MTSEPTIASESDFQSAVLSALRGRLECSAKDGGRCTVLEPFGLDVAILVKSPSGTTLRLVEFKAYAGQRLDSVGFGDRKGEGPQVDLLILPDSFVRSLDPLIRWCFGERRYADLTLPRSVITCLDAKQAAGDRSGEASRTTSTSSAPSPID